MESSIHCTTIVSIALLDGEREKSMLKGFSAIFLSRNNSCGFLLLFRIAFLDAKTFRKGLVGWLVVLGLTAL